MSDWETKLFDDYNGEHQTTKEDAEADAYEDLLMEERMYQKWEEER